MNTHDVIELQPEKKFTVKSKKSESEVAFTSAIKDFEDLHRIGAKIGMERDTFRDMSMSAKESVDKLLENLRIKVLQEEDVLPPAMLKRPVVEANYNGKVDVRYSPDHLYKLSQTPTALLSSVKEMADKLGLIIYPFDFIDSR